MYVTVMAPAGCLSTRHVRTDSCTMAKTGQLFMHKKMGMRGVRQENGGKYNSQHQSMMGQSSFHI